MYLKQIELMGFKSFAEKTRLQFEPGMISIVGPNGCGKSNVSDAIRWVLGEQRPTTLRCARMPDVVFNGTDTRKPLGMAEVSITFSDCEGVLDTEFNEVTITRRVFRSGDGQYFINKSPARLKDIHRLFMGTGIGTTSYSVMAQGQIDAVLSSRPEDRRAIFEEAAGITKFKADRKEAMRKIEQTDANLLRLADVIREVKRQIGSLQRQAGKAQKYKELRDELRGLDIFLTRGRLAALDVRVRELDVSIHDLSDLLVTHQTGVAEAETDSASIHGLIHETEGRIATLTEQAAQADNRYVRAQEVIKVNEQRIEEYRAWSERDNREITDTQAQVGQIQLQLESLAQKRVLMQESAEIGRAKLEETQTRFDAHRAQMEQTRAQLQQDRQRSVECERRTAQIQQTIAEMESRQRELVMKRERLASEHRQLSDNAAHIEQVCAEVKARLDSSQEAEEFTRERFETLEQERNDTTTDLRALQDETARLQSDAAAKRAQIDLLTDRRESSDEYAGGSKQLLDPSNPLELDAQSVLGTLADKFNAPQTLRLALEAALRAWMDAVVVRDAETARAVVTALLAKGSNAAARLIVAEDESSKVLKFESSKVSLQDEGQTSPPDETTNFRTLELSNFRIVPLLSLVTVADDFQAAAQRMLGNVFLAETLAEVPSPLPQGCSVVTRDGAMFHADGCVELWMPDSQVSSPLARRMLVADTSEQLATLEETLNANRARLETLGARSNELALLLNRTRQELDETRRKAAQAEGEHQTVSRDAERVRARLQQVAGELDALKSQTSDDETTSGTLAAELNEMTVTRNQLIERTAEQSALLHEMEITYGDLSQNLTECRIQMSSITQQLEHTASQADALQMRIDELDRTIQGRARGVMSYDESIARLTAENQTLDASLEPLKQAAETLHLKIEETRRERATRQHELEKNEAVLSERRRVLDTVRDNKNRAEIEVVESRMRRQNQIDHIYNEYGLSVSELVAHADPVWKNGQPPIPEIEARVAELSAGIQALGPVNLVAIEEYKELEERYTFLKAQEEDLQNSREQIVQLITMINTKSGELFQSTFEQANANFEKMFTKLFNGGQAKLVLLENSEDPLECGIDIIARPPGKRPQSVTLLSGGERTMTAVSLLFAIFMIKPAPFCMLDELDAALDDSNIGRFVQALKEFLTHSQFLIITHNQHTIAASDIIYGVTQQEKGISKIVSMRLHEIGNKKLAVEAPGAKPAPTIEVETVVEEPSKRSRKKKTGMAMPD
ncbi:MAG: chromosome segregation protein SMC [Kiritimatiellaeota bacterium]|nr:chromosome segregation protein SMC [Kiritimatiellota bacterium]